ncbi:MAG: UvrD-helicase domain-containing protein [Thermonemataceae bacterium]
MSEFKIYNSSAGSGKTYTLTKAYLTLTLNSYQGEFIPDYFKRILAITFTNEAANEMKARVLNTLKAFATGEAHPMLQDIQRALQLPANVLRERAQIVFNKIIYNYSAFSISTIDSFFNRITAAFTQELNVPFNYEIDLDTETLLRNVIDNVINKVGTEENNDLTQFVIEYASDQIDTGKNWKTIHRNLHNFSKKLLDEKSLPIMKGMHALQIQDFKEIISEAKTFITDYAAQLQQKAQTGWQLITEKGLKEKDFYYGNNGVGGYFKKQTEHPTAKSSYLNSYVQKALEEDIWYTTKSKNGAAIDSIKASLRTLIEDIEALRAQQQGAYESLQSILKHLYTVSLINEIRQAFEFVKMRNNIVHISETNHKIAQIIQHEPVPFIYERLGDQYNHLLIDEFQDTSVLQWQNLLPLIENNLAEQHFNMLVGDAKQAIYRWRGGEMEQLVHIGGKNIDELAPETSQPSFLRERYEHIFPYITTENLDTNYRSAAEIVQFNNDFFATVTQKYYQAAAIYDDHFKQQVPEQSPKGAGITFQFLEKENYEETTLDAIENLIDEAQALGFERQHIAILCRKNTKAIQIATYLKERGIEVVSADSLLLASDEKVNFLIALLKVIENPENSLAKSEALYLFYKIFLCKLPDTATNKAIRHIVYDEKATVEDFYRKLGEEGYWIDYAQIQALGIYEIVEELLITFQIYERYPYKLAYIFRFMDWVLEYSTLQSNHLTDFLEEWELKKGSLCVSAPKDSKAVTITTIHRAKGLEYPIVILPFADWQVIPPNWDSMWVNIEQSDLPLAQEKKQKLKHTLINMRKSIKDEAIGQQLTSEQEKSILENLNLLYVAFTRPVYMLHVLTKNPTEYRDQNTVSQWLKSFLENKVNSQGEPFWNPSQLFYKFGEGQPTTRPHNTSDDAPYFLNRIISTNTHKKWKL